MKHVKSNFLNYNKTGQSYLMIALFILFLFQLLSGCEKENGYGSVKVTVIYPGRKMSNVKVFYKKGMLTNPNILLENYDGMLTSNSSGEITFDNIAPGNYFLYAKAIDTDANRVVEGSAGITVRQRFRDCNTYDVIIVMH